MTPWYKTISAHIGMRCLGLVLLGLSVREGLFLCAAARTLPGNDVTPGTLLLAALLFIGISVGTALTWLGPALWKPVTVSDRWAERGRIERRR